MPSCTLSWGSWNSVLAGTKSHEDGHAFRDEHVLGTGSPKMLLYKSTGIGFCGIRFVNIFPDTQSAVVVFTSGTNCDDTADFVASLMIQERFRLSQESTFYQ